MDIQQQNQQPISDDQELAKVLAGVGQQADDVSFTAPAGNPVPTNEPEIPELPELPTMPDAIATLQQPVETPAPEFNTYEPAAPANSELDLIKKDALSELRPLVDKLNVSPEEKFDTYLLLLRSTDDQSLIGPAHEAARSIADEARRAQALLDIIKEIDFLSAPRQAA